MNEFAIHDAAGDGDLERVRQLIEAGVSVDSLDEQGQTPLHRAARYGQYEVAGLLINSECDLDIKDRHRGYTPVMVAGCFGKKAIMVLLLNHGAKVNCIDNNGWTLLHMASAIGWTDILRLILDSGEADLNGEADFNIKGWNTPLMLAARRGNEEVAALLIRAGADVNRGDAKKWTALHYAAQRLRTRVIQILLKKEGLDLNPQDVKGVTPLHLACQNYYFQDGGRINRPEVIELLLDAGADTNIRDNKGKTALIFGIRKGNLTIEDIRLFFLKGAFLENCDVVRISRRVSRNPAFCRVRISRILKKNILKDVELCTQSVVNKFNCQSLPTLNSVAYLAGRLPNVNNFQLRGRHIDEVENLVKSEIERNTFCNVVKVRPISLSALCVLSLITSQPGKKRAASPDFGHSSSKKNRN